jgi:hypothetical protein
MLRFACDWCKRLKEPEEDWILGYSAEMVGAVAARREVTVLSDWSREQAVHPFAVHFCSVDHKDKYVTALFESVPTPRLERPHKPAREKVVSRTVKKRTSIARKRA